MPGARLELVWPGKDQFLLTPTDTTTGSEPLMADRIDTLAAIRQAHREADAADERLKHLCHNAVTDGVPVAQVAQAAQTDRGTIYRWMRKDTEMTEMSITFTTTPVSDPWYTQITIAHNSDGEAVGWIAKAPKIPGGGMPAAHLPVTPSHYEWTAGLGANVATGRVWGPHNGHFHNGREARHAIVQALG